MEGHGKPNGRSGSPVRIALLRQAAAALDTELSRTEATTGETDEETRRRLDEELERRGLKTAARSFTVSGTVRDLDGRPVGRQRLLAFDLDLRGIRARRDAATLSDLGGDAGFEPLGETTSEPTGSYSIAFYDWQYLRAERGTADVVVFAIDGEERIIASSRLTRTDDHAADGLVRNLDLLLEPVAETGRGSEFARTGAVLEPFLEQSEVSLESLAGAGEEIAFLAGELGIEPARVAAAAAARELALSLEDKRGREGLAELAYGLARQDVPLDPTGLLRRPAGELAGTLETAAAAGRIDAAAAGRLDDFLRRLRALVGECLLGGEGDEGSVEELLAPVLPEAGQRRAYADAVASFGDGDPAEFWSRHLPEQEEFRDRPELVEALRVTAQLNTIAGGHRPLVRALVEKRGVRSTDDLLALSSKQWIEAVAEAGVPGKPDADDGDVRRSAAALESALDGAHPTRRVARLVAERRIPIEDRKVATRVADFLDGTEDFHIGSSRISDFEQEIEKKGGKRAEAVTSELRLLQRLFQVSTSPSAMATLYERGLTSAHSIAAIPRRNFLATHAEELGGEEAALAVHERAAHVSARVELVAARLLDYSREDLPASVLDPAQRSSVREALAAGLPSYEELFGSPDMCECGHCNSVYSPSAYLVELLRFLWRGPANELGETPLDVFARRRPDVLHLPLTCENATTLIPYVDLANEVMEHYVANDSLSGFHGHDTGEAGEAELRAAPQHSNPAAHRVLAEAVHPFTLPYHRPLDTIRTSGDQLGVSRHEAMRSMHPKPDSVTARAIATESLRASPKEYELLTGETFDGTTSGIGLHEAYGYATAADLENLSAVPELLRRTGVSYPELVELVETRFINPRRGTLERLQPLLAAADIGAAAFFGKLREIAEGDLDPAADADIGGALAAYNSGRAQPLSPERLGEWMESDFSGLRDVVTLYEPHSRSDLETTELRTLGRIYEDDGGSGVTAATWARLHRFVRLWRRLGLGIRGTDVLLAALGQAEIGPETIERLEHARALLEATGLGAEELAVFWGSIDTGDRRSLYHRLFLKQAGQVDEVFLPDAAGAHLSEVSETLAQHRSALLAAFRLRDAELEAIARVARLRENGTLRPLDLAADLLDLPNLSTIHRHALLARALKLPVAELCNLIETLGASPFSIRDLDQGAWVMVDPARTRAFLERAESYKEADLTPAVLAYAIEGRQPPDGRLGLLPPRVQETVRTLREGLSAIAQEHPASAPSPLGGEELEAQLLQTFEPEAASRLLAILDGSVSFEAHVEADLDIGIPAGLAGRYTYAKADGRLTASGVMPDADRAALKALAGAETSFKAAVDALYSAPEEFLAEQFAEVFPDTSEAAAILLDRPARTPAATLEQRLAHTYEHFVPLLVAELRRRLLVRELATLLGAGESAIDVLVGDGVAQMLGAVEAADPPAGQPTFEAAVTGLHRAVTLATRLRLDDAELRHLVEHADDFDGLDLSAPSAARVARLVAYVRLRDAVSEGRARLIDVFALAGTTPNPEMAALKELTQRATGWNAGNLAFLFDHFGLSAADLTNEVALGRLRSAIEIAGRTGVPARTLVAWAEPSADFDVLTATAQSLWRSLVAAYEEEDGLEIAGQLSDGIRAHLRDALVARLLTRPEIREWGATDANGLYEYLLIDVQMGACMESSRIVNAYEAVQQFVHRCLLNLESDTSGGGEAGVSPAAIDRDRWEWMKRYRLQEAARKVLLYPEVLLAPEWRTDRSEFFRDLESQLTQNDVTDRSVEEALRAYLTRLDEVANLDVCGTHRENHADGRLRFLHVFGRTQGAPYAYYHRTWDEYRKWSPWSRVPVDIRPTEDAESPDGAGSGVTLVPVVWKGRLFLFWPEFVRVSEPPETGSSSAYDVAKDSFSNLSAGKKLQIRLAWSELVDGKWTPKAVTKEFVEQVHGDGGAEKDYLFTPSINEETQALTITVSNNRWYRSCGSFRLADVRSPVEVDSSVRWLRKGDSNYSYEFGKRRATAQLVLEGDLYLGGVVDHGLLPLDTHRPRDVSLDDPFFYRDRLHTYFVRPVKRGLWDRFEIPPIWIDPPPVKSEPVDPFDPFEVINPGSRRFAALAAEGVELELAGPRRARTALDSPPPVTTPVATRTALKGALVERPFGFSAEVRSPFPGDGGRVVLPGLRSGHALEFHTFHHPYTQEYVKRLNQGGVSGLFAADTELGSDEGTTFEGFYDPNFGRVLQPEDFAQRTYYKQNVCFDVYGANSSYNMELFFHVPLYIAMRLSRNGRHEEAMRWFHHIFDPTTDAAPAPGEPVTARYWKVKPFKTTPVTDLGDWLRSLGPNPDPSAENATIAEWRSHPFDPHRVAANRPIAYMKHVVIAYVENLVDWADTLFRKFDRESVFEALQLYTVAAHVLGPRFQQVPRRGEIAPQTYASLESSWDDFSNALVALENAFPFASEVPVSDSSAGPNLLGVGSALYFCVPPNERLLEHWERVEDRLAKIRHCQDIDGVERQLALFAPPIDPAALVQAAAQGLSIGSILADLGAPPPIYRFTHLLQRANEFCGEVRSLGQSLLAAIEKRDAEELGRLRAAQEKELLERIAALRERGVLDAGAGRENLLKAREAAALRLRHHLDLLGESIAVPPPPTIGATLNADSQLPADTTIRSVGTGADTALVESGEAGIKVIGKEKLELDLSLAAKWVTFGVGAAELVGGIASLFPQLDAEGTPLGVGAGAWWGGQNIGAALSALARAGSSASSFLSQEAAQAARVASYIRREQEWAYQANAAAREIVQLDKQITSAEIKVQVAEKELANHRREIEQAEETEAFLRDKFSGEELYQWMQDRLVAVHKQSYTLAYELAKQCEKAFQQELGEEGASFIQYGYLDETRRGLLAGEQLQLALRRLESAHLNGNRRELELSKSISLQNLDPLALVQLRETGRCVFSVPEEIFDLDFPGHYFRRIKAVRLSIPCIAGPHTTIGCTLRLLENSVRLKTTMSSSGGYEHENEEGVPLDDDRFASRQTPVTAIATSTAQGDPGVFELNFRDERYLPFEYVGTISRWAIELATEDELRQFDYSTMSDAILRFDYMARETGGQFREKAQEHAKAYLANKAELAEQPLVQMLSARSDFPGEWHAFLHPAEGDEHVLRFAVGRRRLPFLARDREVVLAKITLLVRSRADTTYTGRLTTIGHDQSVVESEEFAMPRSADLGELNQVSLGATDAGLDLESVDIEAELALRLKPTGTTDWLSPGTDPDEIEDVLTLLHYRLA